MKKPVAITLVLVLINLAIGWFGYDWALGYVISGVGVPIIVGSVQEAFEHRLIASLSTAIAGISIGLGAWVYARNTTKYHIKSVSVLFLVFVIASGIWLQYLKLRMSALPRELAIATDLPISSLPISEVNIYEVGLFASGVLWVVAICLFILNRSRFESKGKLDCQ